MTDLRSRWYENCNDTSRLQVLVDTVVLKSRLGCGFSLDCLYVFPAGASSQIPLGELSYELERRSPMSRLAGIEVV